MDESRAPGFPIAFYSFAALSATSVPCRVLGTVPGCDASGCQALWDRAGVADPGSTLPAGTEVISLGGRARVCLSMSGEVQEAFDSAAERQSLARTCVRIENNCLGSSLLKVSPQEMVQEIHQVLMDREDTCHRTCFSLQLDGNVLDNFAELKTIDGLQEGSLLKVVEGKFLQTSGGNE